MSLLISVLGAILVICAALLLVYLVLLVWLAKMISNVFSTIDRELKEPTDHHRSK